MTDAFTFNHKHYTEAPEGDDEGALCAGCAFHDDIDCSQQRLRAEEVFGERCSLRGVIYVEVRNG